MTTTEDGVIPVAALIERLAALEAIEHGLKTAIAGVRAQVIAAGVETWRAAKVAPTWRHPLGAVSLRVPKDAIAVVDEQAFLDWVLAETDDADDAVEVVTRVRPAYQQHLMGELQIVDGVILDKSSGALVDIPGVSVLPGGDPRSVGGHAGRSSEDGRRGDGAGAARPADCSRATPRLGREQSERGRVAE